MKRYLLRSTAMLPAMLAFAYAKRTEEVNRLLREMLEERECSSD